ncbi:hypothetical protein J6590_038246 [Homalodisca vitripennis]|nr:hypothetical protein J6590_038246 [Homalodisca vitripennis]
MSAIQERMEVFQTIQERMEVFQTIQERMEVFQTIQERMEVFQTIQERMEVFQTIQERMEVFQTIQERMEVFVGKRVEQLSRSCNTCLESARTLVFTPAPARDHKTFHTAYSLFRSSKL